MGTALNREGAALTPTNEHARRACFEGHSMSNEAMLADPVAAALSGEDAARRFLAQLHSMHGSGDELHHAIVGVGGMPSPSPEQGAALRAFCRALQKNIERRP